MRTEMRLWPLKLCFILSLDGAQVRQGPGQQPQERMGWKEVLEGLLSRLKERPSRAGSALAFTRSGPDIGDSDHCPRYFHQTPTLVHGSLA